MCGGGKGGDGGAAERAKAEEAARQAKIKEGQGLIDKAFAQYNDDYYNNYKGKYLDYYNADLDKQYSTAVDELTAQLAGRGMLESTSGAAQIAKLAETLSTQKSLIANQAGDEANNLRAKMESGKSDLYALNQSSADPAAINARALASAGSFVAPASFNPLASVFADVLSPVIASRYANSGSAKPASTQQSGVTLASAQGSGKVRG